jgi:CheY-like chemotaxis protein
MDGLAFSSHLRILVVDDNHDSAATLAALLRAIGHTVVEAYDGRAATALAAEFEPDLVLLDLQMPGMDGFDVIRELRARQRHGARSFVIALTGYGDAAYREATTEEGFDAHLQKPLDLAKFSRIASTIAHHA